MAAMKGGTVGLAAEAAKSAVPKVPTDPGQLAVNMALISFAALLVYAGFKGGSIIDVFNGNIGSQGKDSNPANKTNPGVLPNIAETVGVEIDKAGKGTVTAKAADSAPGGTTQFDGKPVANWIVPILKWARANGWKGRVNSGYRNQAQQYAAASRYGLSHYPNGDPSGSNHTKKMYPGGAVDVSDPEGLNNVLKRYRGIRRLVWGGPVINDQPHFSATGH